MHWLTFEFWIYKNSSDLMVILQTNRSWTIRHSRPELEIVIKMVPKRLVCNLTVKSQLIYSNEKAEVSQWLYRQQCLKFLKKSFPVVCRPQIIIRLWMIAKWESNLKTSYKCSKVSRTLIRGNSDCAGYAVSLRTLKLTEFSALTQVKFSPKSCFLASALSLKQKCTFFIIAVHCPVR